MVRFDTQPRPEQGKWRERQIGLPRLKGEHPQLRVREKFRDIYHPKYNNSGGLIFSFGWLQAQ